MFLILSLHSKIQYSPLNYFISDRWIIPFKRIPMVEQNGKVFHAITYKTGMSLVAMLQSTNTPSDTFKRDNPTVTDEVVEGAVLALDKLDRT